MTWRTTTLGPLLLLSTLGCREPAPEPQGEAAHAQPPDILLVVVDSMRADRLLMERDGQPLAPTMARLAREGVVFEQAYANSGWTIPGLSAILAGRYPPPITLYHGYELGWLPEETHTLPEVLGLYGYHSAAFWGRTVPGGFEELSQGFDEVFVTREQRIPEQPYRHDLLAWLADAPAEPRFVLLHNMDLHHADPPLPASAVERWEPAEPNLPVAALDHRYATLSASHDESTARRETIGAYDAALSFYDAELEVILSTVQQSGRETVIALCSNHGEDLWDHGFLGHGSRHFDSVLRIPLLWWDDALPPGREPVQRRVQAIDIAPSLLARAGATVDGDMDGRSLLPLLGLAEGSYPERPVFSFSSPRGKSVIRADHKLLVFAGRADDDSPLGDRTPALRRPTSRVYDLSRDPRETTDLAPSEPRLTAELEAVLQRWLEEQHGGTAPTHTAPTDEAFRRTLQQRGYWEHITEPAPPPPEPEPPR